MLESHVPGNSQAWLGEGQLEKGQYMAPRWLPTPLRTGKFGPPAIASALCPVAASSELRESQIRLPKSVQTALG